MKIKEMLFNSVFYAGRASNDTSLVWWKFDENTDRPILSEQKKTHLRV